MGITISRIRELAAESEVLNPGSVSLIQDAIGMKGLRDDEAVEWGAVHEMYCLIGQHRVKLTGEMAAFALMGNPEQDAQNFLQDLARKMMSGAKL